MFCTAYIEISLGKKGKLQRKIYKVIDGTKCLFSGVFGWEGKKRNFQFGIKKKVSY